MTAAPPSAGTPSAGVPSAEAPYAGPLPAEASSAGNASATAAAPDDPAAVRSRYDELAELVSWVQGRPAADPALTAAVAPHLVREARLLDSGRFEEWLEGWTDDAVVWVPLSVPAHPGRDQALFLDDRRRLAERVSWRRDPAAWGQQPPSITVRAVTGVEAWPAGSRVVARSSLVVHEQRHGLSQQLAGYQIHELADGPARFRRSDADGEGPVGELAGDPARFRTKIIVMPALSLGVRNPSFLM